MVLLLLLACSGGPEGAGDPDGDGAARDVDCDEGDPDVYPGAPEFCRDGVVNDCASTEVEARAFCALWRDVTAEEASATLRGADGGDRAGAALAGVGDVTGDGVVDLLVGAPGYGGAWIVSGAVRGREDLTIGDAVLTGEDDAPAAGTAVAGPGDIDGDGIADVIVAAPGEDSRDDAAVYVARGPLAGDHDLADFEAFRGEQGIGAAVATGDVDDDGAIDLVLGAPTVDDGGVYVVTGGLSDGRTVDDGDLWLAGDTRDALAGQAVAVGDLDGDGVSDLVAGVPGADEGRGAVVILWGPPGAVVDATDADVVLTGPEPGAGAGSAVATGGDVDGDGRVDLVAGAPAFDGRGAAYVLTDVASGQIDLAAHAVLDAAGGADEAGAGVAFLGDVDGDGDTDIGVGAPHVGSASGAAYVVYAPVRGHFDLADSDIVIETAYDEDELGRVLAGAGDLDGDGRADFLVGSPLHGEGGADAGVAWVFLAAPI